MASSLPGPDITTNLSQSADNSTATQKKLTFSDEQSDLQKAIEESLKSQTTTATRDEDEISKALYESYVAAYQSSEKEDPELLVRSLEVPVGLRNVGYTCWFNAVIQPLFYIRHIRQLILEAEVPVKHKWRPFLQELRKNLALLFAGNKKYVDPTATMNILKQLLLENSRIHLENQQDVSEFQHILFEILDEVYPAGGGDDSGVEKMLHGKYQIQAKSSFHEVVFGQFLLCVEGMPDIHSAIEAAVNDTVTESKIWFTQFPKLMIFDLSRFHFDSVSKQTVKLHSRLHFPSEIYLDRYFIGNIVPTDERRRIRSQLQSDLEKMQLYLTSLLSYGPKNKPYPIQDAFQLVLDYLGNDKQQVSASVSEMIAAKKAEIVAEIASLREEITSCEDRIAQLFESEDLKKIAYSLHAVLVHEGEASCGHYWAYVWDQSQHKWWKFNDALVTPVSWEELAENSFGGRLNSAAYCLIYADSTLELSAPLVETTPLDARLDHLTTELRTFVVDMNAKFIQELEANVAPPLEVTTESPAIQERTSSFTVTAEDVRGDTADLLSATMVNIMTDATHLDCFNTSPREALIRSLNTYIQNLSTLTPQKLESYLSQSDSRLENIIPYILANKGQGDLSETVLGHVVISQVADCSALSKAQKVELQLIREAARREVATYEDRCTSEDIRLVDEWQLNYYYYRLTASCLVTGIGYHLAREYEKAIPLLCAACYINSTLLKATTRPNYMRGFPNYFLAHFRQTSFRQFSRTLLSAFRLKHPLDHFDALINWLPQVLISSADATLVETIRQDWCDVLTAVPDDDPRMPLATEMLCSLLSAEGADCENAVLSLDLPQPTAQLYCEYNTIMSRLPDSLRIIHNDSSDNK